MHRMLIISCHSPDHERAAQALHATLAAASLDMPVTLLWLDDGLKQLHSNPDTPFSKMLQQLELFDDITLLQESTPTQEGTRTPLAVSSISPSELHSLMQQHHTVMVY